MAQLRVFEVPAVSPTGKPEPPTEWDERITVAAMGDQAKRGAKAHLESMGYNVRSLNWGPVPGKAPELVAYVTKKEG